MAKLTRAEKSRINKAKFAAQRSGARASRMDRFRKEHGHPAEVVYFPSTDASPTEVLRFRIAAMERRLRPGDAPGAHLLTLKRELSALGSRGLNRKQMRERRAARSGQASGAGGGKVSMTRSELRKLSHDQLAAVLDQPSKYTSSTYAAADLIMNGDE